MNETTHANATAQTPLGWRNGLAAACWSVNVLPSP